MRRAPRAPLRCRDWSLPICDRALRPARTSAQSFFAGLSQQIGWLARCHTSRTRRNGGARRLVRDRWDVLTEGIGLLSRIERDPVPGRDLHLLPILATTDTTPLENGDGHRGANFDLVLGSDRRRGAGSRGDGESTALRLRLE